MRKYNINASIIRAIDNLYDKAQSAVLFNGSTREWFKTAVGVRQGCLLSPTLFNIFLERIMCEALDDHEGSVSIRGRLITNFRFADDIVINAEEEEEAGVLIDRLDRTTTIRYKMEVGPDKTEVMTNNPNGFQRETLLMRVVWDSTHRGCCSRLLSIPWGTQGTTRRRQANNDAREIDDFIGCEGDFPI